MGRALHFSPMSTATLNALAGLKKKPAAKEKEEKPLLPDPTGALAQAVQNAVTAKQQVEAYTLTLERNNKELTTAAVQHAFTIYAGRTGELEDTFQLKAGDSKAVISLKNDYRVKDVDAVTAALGEHASKFLVKRNTIEIDADAIPPMVAPTFISELIKLAKDSDLMLGIEEDGPCFNAISVKEVTKMDKSFHSARHSLFTPEQNAAIHEVIPCITSVRLHY